MRKIVCIFLSIMLIASLPTIASASSSNESERDTFIQQMCEVFPEYATKIQSYLSSSARSSNQSTTRSIVHQVNREISENETYTYIEYSDGAVLVASAVSAPYVQSVTSEVQDDDSIIYTCAIRMASNVNSDEFVASSVIYKIEPFGYDSIISRGEISDSTTEQTHFISYKSREDATGDAYSTYGAQFQQANDPPLEIRIEFYVGSNRRRVTYI